jgi:hypothetical protein
LQELKARPLQIQGIIFDSSPGRKRFSSLWGALTAILGGPFVAFAAATALALMWAAQNLWYSYILRREEPYGDPFNPLLGDPSTCPQLCLYSQEDKLIAAQVSCHYCSYNFVQIQLMKQRKIEPHFIIKTFPCSK